MALSLVAVPSAARGADHKGAGTHDRQWVTGAQKPPKSLSPKRYEVSVTEASVPLADGTVLTARLHLPVRPAGEPVGPCAVSTNGYAPPSELAAYEHDYVTGPELDDLARRGYAGIFVYLRGGGVPADQALYHRYAEDGYEIVEWAAAQPWCNGTVGMVGGSLSGISQWLTAREAPPSLKAIVPKFACGDCYWNLWYPGGMLPGAGRQERTPPYTPYDEYAAAVAHRDFDGWWRERDTTAADHRAMAKRDIAVLHVGGWDDYLHVGGSHAVEEIVAAGGHGMQVFGPWDHSEGLDGMPGLAPYDGRTLTALWFDRFLRGVDNGIDERGALIFVEGPDQYRFERAWPIRDARPTRMHLRARKSRSARSLNDGSLTARAPRRREASVRYDYDPRGPFNDAGAGAARPAADQRPDERRSLTWTTRRLTRATEVTGRPVVRFSAKSSAADTDFVVELTDVAPDGTSTQVTRGWLNGPRFRSRSHPRPLEPRRVQRFTIELSPMAYVFQRGHRIRLSLSGSDRPGTRPNSNAARVTVLQDARHRSHVELPVVGSAWRQLLMGRG